MAGNVAAQVVRKVDRMRTELQQAQRKALNDAGLAMRREIERTRDRVVGGDKLRNVRGRGGQLRVRYDLEGDDAVRLRAIGAWPLVERPVKAHSVQPRKRGGKKAIAFNGIVVASAEHPGISRPKKPWEKGVDAGTPKAVRTLRDRNLAAIERGFRA